MIETKVKPDAMRLFLATWLPDQRSCRTACKLRRLLGRADGHSPRSRHMVSD